MPSLTKHLKIVFFVSILCISFSCEKESDNSEDTLLTIPIKLVTTDSDKTAGNIIITNGNTGSTTEFSDIKINEVSEITLDFKTDDYHFTSEDAVDGNLDMWIAHDDLKSYTTDNPLILKYGNYKDAVIAEYTISLNGDSGTVVKVELERTSLYYVDWGDGTNEVSDATRYNSDALTHSFESIGEYTVTVSTANLDQVVALSINANYNNDDTTISGIEIGDLPNLNTLGIGNNTLVDATDVTLKFPKLINFVFGPTTINSIDVSNNKELDHFWLRGDNITTINGLNDLPKLNFAILHTESENMDLSSSLDLETLSISNSSLTSLDLSNYTKLKHISIDDAKLDGLDLSNNKELESIVFDDISQQVYDFSELNNLEYIYIRALVPGEVRYPTNMDNMEYINYSSFSSINSVMDFTELMLDSQESNPRKKVTIKYPRNRYPSLPQQDELEVLSKDWDWIIVYKNN